jgi:hypothetical protein
MDLEGTNVLEKHTVSIFRAELRVLRNGQLI